jgi:hypothetical protein
MTKTDVRLAYQSETGHQLETINTVAEHCDPETKEYIDYLEEKLVLYSSYNQHLLNSMQPHLF